MTRRSSDLLKEGDECIKQMQQTVLKEHNFNLAIKLNLNPVAMPSTLLTLSTPFVLNLDSTSNPNSTFNISADIVTKPIGAPTVVVAPTKATKPTNNVLEEEKAMSLDQLLDWGYKKDLILSRVLELLAQGANHFKNLTIADCSVVNKRLHYRGLLYVPNYHVLYLRLCKLHHNTSVAGYLEVENTYKLLHRTYYWPNM